MKGKRLHILYFYSKFLTYFYSAALCQVGQSRAMCVFIIICVIHSTSQSKKIDHSVFYRYILITTSDSILSYILQTFSLQCMQNFQYYLKNQGQQTCHNFNTARVFYLSLS